MADSVGITWASTEDGSGMEIGAAGLGEYRSAEAAGVDSTRATVAERKTGN
jgi:hypothetical protein